MKGKKFLSAVLVLLMTLGIFAALPVKGVEANAIWVEPSTFNATEQGLTIGNQFTVEVWINVTGAELYGFEYKLRWNDTLIHYVSHTHYEPWDPNFVAKDEVTPGQYWYGASALAPAEPFSGVMKVLEITFEIAYQPYFPEPTMSCTLDLVDTKMGDPSATPIPHVAVDGEYLIEPVTPTPPYLGVEPSEFNAETAGLTVNDTFTVNIEIFELAAAWDLYGWEVKLGYDPTLLEVVDVASGGFLPSFAGPDGTFFTYRDRPEYNYVVMADLFLGTNYTKPYGSGVLAQVTFKIIYEEEYPNQAECDLPLFDIKLVSSGMVPIEYNETLTYGGHYVSPMTTPPGAVIDVYTEIWRWPGYNTTNTGQSGVDQTPSDADPFAPQEEATLYALLTYGGAPIQYKEVAWTIIAPNNETYYRQSFTNSKGIANITIRWPWTNEYLGEWTVMAKASVAETTVNDTVTFTVDYVVRVSSSKTLSPVNRGEEVSVNMTITNIGTIERTVFITITIYDDVGMPVATGSWTVLIGPGDNTFTETLTLAYWAHPGQGTVYINVFTAPPPECGVCYAPEHVQTFTITFTDP